MAFAEVEQELFPRWLHDSRRRGSSSRVWMFLTVTVGGLMTI